LKKAYEAAEFEYVSLLKEDIITASGDADDEDNGPIIGDDVNSELPFVPRK
jgi:hypothetical protein